MLEIGRARAIDDGILDGIEWLCGDAEALPFADRSFDLYTIAFGLRNVTRIERALAEARRVLKPGGRFLCLEFTPAVAPLLQPLYDLYSFQHSCRCSAGSSPATATPTPIWSRASGGFRRRARSAR